MSRIPLYSTMKAIFLLYLALPQTQGATYVYTVHLRPFFANHEQQIDQAIAEVRARLYRFVQEKARAVWQAVLGALAPPGTASPAAQQGANTGGPTQPPPTFSNPAAGPAQLISSLWTSYGPSIIAGGTALLRQTAAATLPDAGIPATAAQSQSINASTFGRRPSRSIDPARGHEGESSSLSMPQSIPPANNPARQSSSSRASSSSSGSSPGLRERTISGKFEEIQGGDIEGYDIDGEHFIGGFVQQQQPAGSRSSWFGWSHSSTSRKDGYERVKAD